MPKPSERPGQGPGHPGQPGAAVWRTLHQAGRGHQGLHLQGEQQTRDLNLTECSELHGTSEPS